MIKWIKKYKDEIFALIFMIILPYTMFLYALCDYSLDILFMWEFTFAIFKFAFLPLLMIVGGIRLILGVALDILITLKEKYGILVQFRKPSLKFQSPVKVTKLR